MTKAGIQTRVEMIKQLLTELVGMFSTGINGTGHDIKRTYKRRGRGGAAAKDKQKDNKN
jgi:hypothetical protein